MSDRLQICEVAPRDGLQSLGRVLTVNQRIEFCRRLIRAGLTKIEVGALVNPQAVPAMADSDQVFISLKKEFPDASLSLLIPNEKGLLRALEIGVSSIAFFTATSETFNRKNINRSVKESISLIGSMAEQARQGRCNLLRLYISTVFDCAYEGSKNPIEDLPQFEPLFSLVDEISLGDTTGRGDGKNMSELLGWLAKKSYKDKIWWHFHDTWQRAEELARLALAAGYRKFDSSAGGIGGCPFSPGAKGNIDTMKLIKLAHDLSIPCDIDIQKINMASKDIL